jgi:hypothetical protein
MATLHVQQTKDNMPIARKKAVMFKIGIVKMDRFEMKEQICVFYKPQHSSKI